ncbi:MAG: hypothetical protein NT120_00045 [Candidatus Aenigmarchaeota archaeon]|nr:hypothetical protein [Candidatus Aenigmarchaeota archaeon]
MKKGLELPVNMIIVIAIAVLVLVVVAAFFSGSFLTGTDTVKYQGAITSSCMSWRSAASPCSDSFLIKVGTDPSVAMSTACAKAYPNEASATLVCQRLCGCPGV